VTATKSWGPTLTESVRREVDYQVAAPTEARTPTWHRAKIAHQRVRLEGWRQGQLGSKEDHSTIKSNYKTILTLTGLLMEGLGGLVGINFDAVSPLVPTYGERRMWISSLRCAVRVLLGICLLSSAFVPAYAQLRDLADQNLKPQETGPCGSTEDTIPGGIAVVLPPGEKGYKSGNLEALNNPFVSGVAVQINWRDIEPVQGKPDWSKLDELFAAAEKSKKWVQLDIFPGFFSPEWALEGAKTDLFPILYGPGTGTVTKLPMPWDRVYLNRWFTFLKQLGERYGRSPAFRMIAASGPTSVSEEMTLPANPRPAIQKWLADGYTPAKYLGAWEQAFHVYADTFPNQCVSLAAPNLPILGQGQSGRPAHLRASHEVVDRAKRVLGRRLAIQTNNLHAGRAKVETADDTDFIKSYSGQIITGFEMRGGSHGRVPSKVMGAEGNPPLALRKSIDKGMAANSAGRHVNYLEIYQVDVLSADMQPVLEYAASLFGRPRP
jgi:hypothetical protein